MRNTQKTYRYIDFPPLTKEQEKELEKLKNMKDEDIDTSETGEFQDNGGFYYYVNSLKVPQSKIYTNIDNDNLDWLKRAGKGYQKRLNDVIRWARMNNCPLA